MIRHLGILIAAILTGMAPIAQAGLIYNFNTILELDSGPDTGGLDGASMSFTAEIPDGTTYIREPFIGVPAIYNIDYEWIIAGSSSQDGHYSDSQGAVFASSFGWFGPDAMLFEFANFSFMSVAIWHRSSPTAMIGGEVTIDDFGPINKYIGVKTWGTRDGSKYNWLPSAQFSVVDMASVPLPSTISLMFLALLMIRQRIFAR